MTLVMILKESSFLYDSYIQITKNSYKYYRSNVKREIKWEIIHLFKRRYLGKSKIKFLIFRKYFKQ
jgi:hypothetical protein